MELDLTGLQLPAAPEEPREGQVVLRPLERGYGHTLGNTLRRILLSSLRGSAVWAFRTDGVLHEHQTIPGVVEDVHQVIKNLKALVLKLDDDVDSAVLEVRAEKAGPVTARAIREHGSVTVVSEDHHILELQEDRDLRMELYVNKGRGFVLAEDHPLDRDLPADLVRIDAVYNPVRRANFVVEETRVGQRTDFDRLVLQVETNGSIDVPRAVQYAAHLAIEHFGFLAGGRFEQVEDRPWAAAPSTNGQGRADDRNRVTPNLLELLTRPIEEVEEISVRSRNSLQRSDIHTVRDLVVRSKRDMLEVANFGKKSLEEVEAFLIDHGLRFGLAIEQGEDGTLWWGEATEEAEEPAQDGGEPVDADESSETK